MKEAKIELGQHKHTHSFKANIVVQGWLQYMFVE